MRLVLFLLLCVFLANAAPSFTVAIVVQNQPVYLRNLLRSLWTLKYHERLLVESVDVLVIEGSKPIPEDVSELVLFNFTVVRGTRTLSEAYNQAWLNARTTHVVFLSDDNELLPRFIENAAAVLSDDVAIVSSLMLNADNITVFHSYIDFRLAQIEKKKNWMTGDSENVALPVYMYQGYSKHDPRVTSKLNVDAVSRSGMIVRRDLLEQLGGFNTTFVNGSQQKLAERK